jgi:maleate isomerase
VTKRIGMITPSSNTVLEPVTTAMTVGLHPRVSVHYTRIEVTAISLDRSSQSQFDLGPMLAAAQLLSHAGMDAIVWNGTSGAWRGIDDDRALCDAIEREVGAPATTATLAQVEAFRRFGVQRYGLAVPYLPAVRDRIAPTYGTAGFECVSSALLAEPIEVNHRFAEVPPDEIRDLVRRADSPSAEAISVICTNFPAAWLVDELEAELGKPVFDSTVLAVWAGLRLAGVADPIPGWGRLAAQHE